MKKYVILLYLFKNLQCLRLIISSLQRVLQPSVAGVADCPTFPHLTKLLITHNPYTEKSTWYIFKTFKFARGNSDIFFIEDLVNFINS